MALEKDGNTFIANCDECPESQDTFETDFTAARAAAVEKGWRIFKGPDQQWAISCPGCVRKFALEQAARKRR